MPEYTHRQSPSPSKGSLLANYYTARRIASMLVSAPPGNTLGCACGHSSTKVC